MKGKLRKANAVIDDDARLRKEYADTQNELEIAREQLESLTSTALNAVSATPSLAPIGRCAPIVIRKMAMHMLAKKTPPAAVVPNIVAVLKYMAPEKLKGAHLPGTNFVRVVRREMLRVAKTLAADSTARLEKIDSIHVDGSSLDQHDTAAVGVCRGKSRVILDASGTVDSKTAAGEANHVEACFADLHDMLVDWDKEAERSGVASSERTRNIAAADDVGLHQAGRGGAVETDNAPQALALSKIVQQKIVAAAKSRLESQGLLEAMSADEVKKATACYGVTCHHHLRNILVAWGARASTARLKEKLEAELIKIPERKRLSPDADALVRSIWKEFAFTHGNYAKGQGYKLFLPWLTEEKTGQLYLAPPRGDCGSRHDFSTESAMYLYWDRPLLLEFLHSRRFDQVGNILEDAIYTMLSCVEMIGEIRARAIIQDKIVDALRFFSGSKTLAWGPLDMSHVYNVLENFLQRAQHDGNLLLDANLNVWGDFSDVGAYVAWEQHRSEETAKLIPPAATPPSAKTDNDAGTAEATATSEQATAASTSEPEAEHNDSEAEDDKPSRVAWRPLVRKELYDPEDPTNIESDEATVASLEAWCTAMLKSMAECPVSDYLDSFEGKFSEGHASEQTKEDLTRDGDGHLERTNDLAESIFGVVDDYYHSFPNMAAWVAAGVAQMRMNHTMDIAYVNARARKEPSERKIKPDAPQEDGAFTRLDEASADALINVARLKLPSDTRQHQARIAAQHLYHREIEAAKKKKKLASIKTAFKLAVIAFKVPRLDSHAALAAALSAARSDASRVTLLKAQVRHYVNGLGLVDAPFGPTVRFSDVSDPNVGTLGELTQRIKKMITAAKKVPLPSEPVLPQLNVRSSEAIGKMIPQRALLKVGAQAEAKAMQGQWLAEIEKSEAATSSRARQPRAQPKTPPTASEMVGQRIEVLFNCRLDVLDKSGKKTGKQKAGTFWCAGEVLEACDERTVINGAPLDNTYALIRYDLPPDAEEGEQQEEEYRQLRSTWFGAKKTKAASWRIAQELVDAVGAAEMLEDLSGGEEEGEEEEQGASASSDDEDAEGV